MDKLKKIKENIIVFVFIFGSFIGSIIAIKANIQMNREHEQYKIRIALENKKQEDDINNFEKNFMPIFTSNLEKNHLCLFGKNPFKFKSYPNGVKIHLNVGLTEIIDNPKYTQDQQQQKFILLCSGTTFEVIVKSDESVDSSFLIKTFANFLIQNQKSLPVQSKKQISIDQAKKYAFKGKEYGDEYY